MNQIKSTVASSVDPAQVSLTVQGVTKALIFVVSYFALAKGFDPTTTTNGIEQVRDIVISLIPAILAVYHGGEAIYGLIRKMFVKKA